MRLRRTDRATLSGENIDRISIGKTRPRDLSGSRADSKHAQGTGVTSGEGTGEGAGRREDRTEAASGAFGGGVFAEDTGKREN